MYSFRINTAEISGIGLFVCQPFQPFDVKTALFKSATEFDWDFEKTFDFLSNSTT
jgi:hypothetical protein